MGETDSETEGTEKLVPEQIENAPGAGCRPQTSKAIVHQSAEMGCAQLLTGTDPRKHVERHERP